MKYPDVFFRSLATPIVFALIALGFHFFLRGHNAPGGGFIAGLIVAVAALLARMARDLRLLRIRSETLVPLGLLLAVATGIAPMLLGYPFLRSAHGYGRLPLIGEFEWSTAVLFDAGVFLVVVGTTITIIDLLAVEANLRRLDPAQQGPARSAGGLVGTGRGWAAPRPDDVEEADRDWTEAAEPGAENVEIASGSDSDAEGTTGDVGRDPAASDGRDATGDLGTTADPGVDEPSGERS